MGQRPWSGGGKRLSSPGWESSRENFEGKRKKWKELTSEGLALPHVQDTQTRIKGTECGFEEENVLISGHAKGERLGWMVTAGRLAEGWTWAGEIINYTPEHQSHLSPRIRVVNNRVKLSAQFP